MTTRRNLQLAAGVVIYNTTPVCFVFGFGFPRPRLSVVTGYLPARIIGFDEAVRLIRM